MRSKSYVFWGMIIIAIIINVMPVMANTKISIKHDNDYAYTEDSEPLDNIKVLDPGFQSSDTYKLIKNMMQSWYGMCQVIGVTGFVITFILCAIKLMITRKPEQRKEIKAQIATKGLLIFLLFGFVYFVGLMSTIVTYFAS